MATPEELIAMNAEQQPLAPWGTTGDPQAAYDQAMRDAGLIQEGSDFLIERPDSPGDYIPVQSLGMENLIPKRDSDSVDIDGQLFTRIGDMSSVAWNDLYKGYAKNWMTYDPTYGWVVPYEFAKQANFGSYTGGGKQAFKALTTAIVAAGGGAAVGAAVGAGAAGAGAVEGGTVAAGTTAGAGGVTTQAAVNAAVQGAAQGAVSAAMQGGDPLQGAMMGAVSGGAGGIVGSFIGADSPLLQAATQAATRAAAAAAASGGDQDAILQAAAMGAASAITGQTASGMFPDNPFLAEVAKGTAASATGAALAGGDVQRAALMGGAMGGLTGLERGGLPSISDQEFEELTQDLDLGNLTVEDGPNIPQGFQPETQQIMLRTPETTTEIDQLMGRQAAQGMLGPSLEAFSAGASPELQAILSGMAVKPASFPVVSDEDADLEEPLPEEAPQEKPALNKFAGAAKLVLKALSAIKGAAPTDVRQFTPREFAPPEREEGMTDEEYAQFVGEYEQEYYTEVGEQAIEYLGLSVDDIAALGLTPGTPEYLSYILEQADSIIRGIFGDNADLLLEGESIEGLQNALRNLTQKETAQLLRALYVRGTLDQMSFRSSYADPFTGVEESTGMLPSGIRGAEAAQQRGYARSFEGMAASPRAGAAGALRQLLGRKVDLYGLQQQQDKRRARDMLSGELGIDLDEEEKRRRQMGVSPESYWGGMLNSIDPALLRRLMAKG